MARWDERRPGRPGERWRDERGERDEPGHEGERDDEGTWGEGDWPPPRLARGSALRDDWRERVERYGGDPGWRELEERDARGRWRGDPRAARPEEGRRGGGARGEREDAFWRGGQGGPSSWHGGESGLRGEARWQIEERRPAGDRSREGAPSGAPPRPADAPREGEGGWRRTSQLSQTGEGPGSWGPDADWRDRWARVERDSGGLDRWYLETSPSAFRGTGGQARGYEERAWARQDRGRTGRGPKGYKRPDDRILEEVCERIARSNVNAQEVEVQVQSGEVRLTGLADSLWDKRSIEDLAAEVFGVEEIQNDIRVKRPIDRAREANRVGELPREPQPPHH